MSEAPSAHRIADLPLTRAGTAHLQNSALEIAKLHLSLLPLILRLDLVNTLDDMLNLRLHPHDCFVSRKIPRTVVGNRIAADRRIPVRVVIDNEVHRAVVAQRLIAVPVAKVIHIKRLGIRIVISNTRKPIKIASPTMNPSMFVNTFTEKGS